MILKLRNVRYINLKQRSSLTKIFVDFVSSGIIDAGYRGGLKSQMPYKQNKLLAGKGLQVLASHLKPIKIRLVGNLNETSKTMVLLVALEANILILNSTFRISSFAHLLN